MDLTSPGNLLVLCGGLIIMANFAFLAFSSVLPQKPNKVSVLMGSIFLLIGGIMVVVGVLMNEFIPRS